MSNSRGNDDSATRDRQAIILYLIGHVGEKVIELLPQP